MATSIVPNCPDKKLGRLWQEDAILQTIIDELGTTERDPAARGARRFGALVDIDNFGIGWNLETVPCLRSVLSALYRN